MGRAVNKTVLVVEDDTAVLEVLRRQLASEFDVVTASGGEAGLELVENGGPFAVVLSDMRMPRMDGTLFLKKVHDVSPDSVRMILSGQTDLDAAIAAVNYAGIYRFLTKPCKRDDLIAAVAAGVEQYGLVIARRELLEQTLYGTVQVLTEILGLTNPVAQQRASRIARYAEKLSTALDMPMPWQLKIAVMLSQIGCITLPEEILARIQAGQALSDEDTAVYQSHPDLAAKLLSGIPRLEAVAEIVSRQLDAPDFGCRPVDLKDWEVADLGAAILRICTDLDEALVTGASRQRALDSLAAAYPDLPTSFRVALEQLNLSRVQAESALVRVSQLRVGMVLDEDVVSMDGTRLLSKGQEVTRSIMLRLQAVAHGVGVVQPFRVTVF